MQTHNKKIRNFSRKPKHGKQNTTKINVNLLSSVLKFLNIKDEKLDIELRKPFNLIVGAVKSGNWLPLQDYFRTFSDQNIDTSDIHSLLKAS